MKKLKIKLEKESKKEKKKALEFINTFKVGDKVRLLKKKSTFSKGTNYYTKSIYEVIEIDKMAIIIRKGNGDSKRVKPYDLKLIDDVEIAPENENIEHHNTKENNHINTFVRKQKQNQPSKENGNNVGSVDT
jgi:hypothetical protein